ncbi:interleukin 17a/f1 [Fundulus diaphanus]
MFPASDSSSVTASRAVAMIAMVVMMAVAMTEAAPRHHSEETYSLLLDPKVLVPSRNLRPLENASISPWAYNTSSDDALFPPVMSEARCLLQGCLDLEGKEDLNLRSRPIMHQVLVLRRVKTPGEGHKYHYRLETRVIAVGCTCVRHMVHIQE